MEFLRRICCRWSGRSDDSRSCPDDAFPFSYDRVLVVVSVVRNNFSPAAVAVFA
jgi:hypothetical protein